MSACTESEDVDTEQELLEEELDDGDDDSSYYEDTSFDIQVMPEEYKQIYEGGGITFNLYHGHLYSMSEANQEKFFELMFRDMDLKYILYNLKYRPDHVDDSTDVPKNLGMYANFLTSAKEYRPNIKTIMIFADFPEDLTKTVTISGEEEDILDLSIDNIYGLIAEWMFDTMVYMHELGHDVDIISVCNEPDWEKDWLWGYEDSSVGVGNMIKYSIPLLEDILASEANTYNLSRPYIMAPSNITPAQCYKYITSWQTDSAIWDEIDMVATHQYVNGCTESSFENINSVLDGRPFIQNEQHTNSGDDLGTLSITDDQRGIASTSSFFEVALKHGVQSWCYFVANMPNESSNAGLMQIAWGGEPILYKQYYVYKQLHSLYSDNTQVLNHTDDSDAHKFISMRTPGENKIIMHVANVTSSLGQVRIDVGQKIKSIKIWLTDVNTNMAVQKEYDQPNNSQYISLETFKYSLYSLEVTLLDE